MVVAAAGWATAGWPKVYTTRSGRSTAQVAAASSAIAPPRLWPVTRIGRLRCACSSSSSCSRRALNCPQKPACTRPSLATAWGCRLRLLSPSAVLSVPQKLTSTRLTVLAWKPWAACQLISLRSSASRRNAAGPAAPGAG